MTAWIILGVIVFIIALFLLWLVMDIDFSAFLIICLLIIFNVVEFFAVAGMLYLICWAFGLTWWSWKICIGVYLILAILKSIFGGNKS